MTVSFYLFFICYYVNRFRRGDYQMKRIIITTALLATLTVCGISTNAQEVSTDDTTVIVSRAAYQTYKFSSYPPKTYKGLVLHQVKKISDGYLGLYI